MRLSLIALATAIASASAYDLRELYTFQGGDGVAFCKAWKCACVNYVSSSDTEYFFGTNCRPGDYQGLNKDTEALASCAFTSDGKTPIVYNDEVAAEVGATHV